jgi:hypothetical protein
MKIWRAILTTTAILCAVGALAGPAAANDLFTLDTEANSAGHVIEDQAGNAYVAWTSEGPGLSADLVKFCKIAPGGSCSPITLPIPSATSLSDSTSAAMPVFGPGSTVYVVGPRYPHNDLVFDGGQKREFYSSKTEPTDAFLTSQGFLVGAYNAGLGVSTDEVAGLGGGELTFADPGDGGVSAASMGLTESGRPVFAYFNFTDPYSLWFYNYKGAGSFTLEGNWSGPNFIGNGYEPRVDGGPAGLFMVSVDYTDFRNPNAIAVRRFDETTSTFGPAKTLAVDPSPDLFVGGAIAQSPEGKRIAVAWPGTRGGDGAFVMRLFTSADKGGSYAESQIAHLGSSYGIGSNADMATNDSGAGWIVFEDSNGLRIADFNPIAGPPPAPVTPPATPVEKAPKPYSGPTKEVTKKAGDFLIVLRLPKSCLQSNQKFFIGVGKRKRRQLEKKLGGTIRFTKVVFIYDGKKVKVKKKKPFRYLVDPGPLKPNSVHVVKAKVTAVLERGLRDKKVKRLIQGTVRAC